jgi:tetratricopeptide (TPR) repeat protein
VSNLEQTHFLVPHWFTEGLAVRAENTPMPPQWSKLLLQRVPEGELMNLDNIHLGFIRPRSPDEWHMAYLQSRQYVEYLSNTFGEKAVAGLLAAYSQGLDTGAAIEKVCQVSKAEFEKGYRQHLEKLTKSIAGNVPQKEPSFRELKDRFAKEPNNPEVMAELARQYLFLGNRDKAQELTDRALAKNPAQTKALFVQARLKLAKDNQPEALELLRRALDKKHPDLEVVQLLGKLRFEAKEYAAAAEIYELGYKAQPYDSQWLVQLVRCYRQTDDQDKLIDTLKKLVPTDTDDLTNRRELAQLLLKANRPAEAETFAREALEIDVMDEAARTVLRESLQAQNKNDEWQQWERLLEGE